MLTVKSAKNASMPLKNIKKEKLNHIEARKTDKYRVPEEISITTDIKNSQPARETPKSKYF